MYSLESPHLGDSNEYTQHTFTLKKIEKMTIVSKVFEPLKFHCILKQEGQEALNRSPEYTDQKSNI